MALLQGWSRAFFASAAIFSKKEGHPEKSNLTVPTFGSFQAIFCNKRSGARKGYSSPRTGLTAVFGDCMDCNVLQVCAKPGEFEKELNTFITNV